MPRRHLKRLVATLVVFVFLGLPTDGDAVAQQKTGAGLSKEELVRKATDHMANDRWAEATNLWSMVIEIDPFYVVGYLNRAMSRFRAGDCDGREVDARRALEVIADSTGLVLPQLESLVYRAQALGHLQDFVEAIRLLEEAVEVQPDYHPVTIVLSQMRRRAEGTFNWVCNRD